MTPTVPTSKVNRSPLVRLQTRDFDQMAAAFQRWDHQFRQLSPGAFAGALSLVQLGPVQLLRVQTNRRILAQGAAPPGCFTFNPVTELNQEAVFRGHHLRVGQLNILAPAAEMNHLTSANYQTLAVTVPLEALFATAARLEVKPVAGLAHKATHSPDPLHCLAFHEYLERLLQELESRPALLNNPAATQRMGQACLAFLVELLAGASGTEEDALPLVRARRLVFRAEELMESALAVPLSTAELCAALDVSERTLRGAFRQVRGMSPIASYKARRLNAVRRELKGVASGSIHEIAQRWGFWHPGEFASDYRRLFGELPSRTLQSGAQGLR
jgi:AraC family ethanolamine operon transcriptional activator